MEVQPDSSLGVEEREDEMEAESVTADLNPGIKWGDGGRREHVSPELESGLTPTGSPNLLLKSPTSVSATELKKLFTILSSDDRNSTSSGDILYLMRSLNQSLSEAELNDFINELNVDLDDMIHLPEMLFFLYHRISVHRLTDCAADLFSALESQGTGTLTRETIKALLCHFSLPYGEEVLKAIMDSMHCENSDFATLSEFISFIDPADVISTVKSLLTTRNFE